MRIDPAGWPFVLGGLLLTGAGAVAVGAAAAVPLLVLTGFFVFFFRDPDRATTVAEGTVVSPADGRVIVAGAPAGQAGPPGVWKQVSIFLSPTDVHVNRMPIGGRVVRVEYHPGRFLPAYRAEAGDLNEFTEVVIDHDGQTVVVRQIVGVLARRIVCRARTGDVVRAGDRFGVMKFGSRMDVFLPGDSTLHVAVGDRVVGGVSVLATLPGRGGASGGLDHAG